MIINSKFGSIQWTAALRLRQNVNASHFWTSTLFFPIFYCYGSWGSLNRQWFELALPFLDNEPLNGQFNDFLSPFTVFNCQDGKGESLATNRRNTLSYDQGFFYQRFTNSTI